MATNWSRLTVVDLRAELKKRSMSTAGKKADLVERLTSAETEAEVEQTEAAPSEYLNTDNKDAPPTDAPTERENSPAPVPPAEPLQETIKKSPSPSPSPAPAATPAHEERDTDLSAQPPTMNTCPDGKRIIPFLHFTPITLFLTNPA